MMNLPEFAAGVVPRAYDTLPSDVAGLVRSSLRAGQIEEAIITVLDTTPGVFSTAEVDQLEELLPEFDGALNKRLARRAISAYRNLTAA